MYNKTIIEFGFCDIRQVQSASTSADYTCLDLDYSVYHKNLIQLLFIISELWHNSGIIRLNWEHSVLVTHASLYGNINALLN